MQNYMKHGDFVRRKSKIYGDSRRSFQKARNLEVLTKIITVLSLLGTSLAFIGYGVAVQAGEQFSVPHESLYSSTLDLIGLSVWAVDRFLSNLTNLDFLLYYKKTVFQFSIASVALFFIWIFVVFLHKSPKAINICRSKLSTFSGKLAFPRAQHSYISVILRCFFYAVLFNLTAPIFYLATIYFMIFVLLIAPLFSVVGMTSAEQKIRNYVIAPNICAPYRDRIKRFNSDSQSKDGNLYATCLKASKDGKEIARGREVFTTTSAVLLFDPLSGVVIRLPLSELTLETLDDLYLNNSH